MNSIVIDDASLTATVSPGVRLGNLYNALYQRNPSYSYSGGTCPNVGLGGHMSAGGYGMLARKKGLAVDNAISARMVLVNGTTVSVSPTLNTDLWFAIRGGGGGSYGIVVEWKLKIQVVPYHYIAHVRYSNLAQFPTILAKYLSWTQTGLASKTNTGTVSYNGWDISLQFQIDPSQIQLLVHYAPDSASSPATLDAILTAAGMVNTGSFSWSYIHQPIQVTTIQAHSFFAQAYTTSDATALSTVSAPAYHTDGNYKELASMKSDYLANMPSSTTNLATAITNSMSACKSSNPYDYCFVQFESYGGQVAAAASTANAAFPHRNVLASMQYAIIFTKPSSTDARNKGTTWINNLQSALAPYVSGGKYQGYVDLDVADPSKYYGGNYGTLQATKAKYDPNKVFWSDLVRPASTGTIWFGSSYAH